MADVVHDVTRRQDALPGGALCVREQGRLVALGSPGGPSVRFDFHWGCQCRSLNIIGAHALSHLPHPPHDPRGTPWTVQRHVEVPLGHDHGSHMGAVVDWRAP